MPKEASLEMRKQEEEGNLILFLRRRAQFSIDVVHLYVCVCGRDWDPRLRKRQEVLQVLRLARLTRLLEKTPMKRTKGCIAHTTNSQETDLMTK